MWLGAHLVDDPTGIVKVEVAFLGHLRCERGVNLWRQFELVACGFKLFMELTANIFEALVTIQLYNLHVGAVGTTSGSLR